MDGLSGMCMATQLSSQANASECIDMNPDTIGYHRPYYIYYTNNFLYLSIP